MSQSSTLATTHQGVSPLQKHPILNPFCKFTDSVLDLNYQHVSLVLLRWFCIVFWCDGVFLTSPLIVRVHSIPLWHYTDLYLLQSLSQQHRLNAIWSFPEVSGKNISQSSNCTATYLLSLNKMDKTWTGTDRLLVTWKSDLSDKMKCNFFQEAVVSILIYGCTMWMLTKQTEKKLNSKCTRMLQTI